MCFVDNETIYNTIRYQNNRGELKMTDEQLVGLVCGVIPAIIIVIAVILAINAVINERRRKELIRNNVSLWGQDVCDALLAKRVRIGMTPEMVMLAWGKPSKIDEKETTAKSEKYRYVYGRPRKGANYIWFKNGVVSKLKT